MSKILLDRVEGIEFDEANPPIGNYQILSSKQLGLFHLANNLRQAEISLNPLDMLPQHVKNRLQDGDHLNTKVFAMGRMPEAELYANYFDWFAISLLNYLRVVAVIELMSKEGWKEKDILSEKNQKLVSNTATQYAQTVVPDVYMWRNKVAAHPALTDPRREDGLGILQMSTMNLVVYSSPYYKIQGWEWTQGGKTSSLPSWSLTEIYDQLTLRFWPDTPIPQFSCD